MAECRRFVRPIALFVLTWCCATTQGAPWRFAVVGDTRGTSGTSPINATAVSAIVQALTTEGIELVLVPGDLVNGATSVPLATQLATWRSAMAPIYIAGIGVYPIRGNHETSGTAAAWQGVFPELPQNGPTTPSSEVGLTYSVSHDNALFIGFDEYVRSHRVNQDYLDGLLSHPNRPAHVFVFGHEPAFASNHADTLDDYPADRDIFWNSLGGAGVPMYFCGHDHFYARSSVADAGGHSVRQLIVGAGGAPFHIFTGYVDPKVLPMYSDDDHYGYLTVEVDGLSVTVRYKAQLDLAPPTLFTTVDQFTYSVPEPPVLGDINRDGHVDVIDLLYMADSWAKTTGQAGFSAICDLDLDGAVGVADLLVFAGNWGT